jgi:hypothetical protein
MKKKLSIVIISFIIGILGTILLLNLDRQGGHKNALVTLSVSITVLMIITSFLSGFLLMCKYLEMYNKESALCHLGLLFGSFCTTSAVTLIGSWKSPVFLLCLVSLSFGVIIKLITYRKKDRIITQDQFWEENKHKLNKELP